MAIKFFFNETRIRLSDRTRLKQFIEQIFKSKKKSLGSLTFVFCTDKYLLDINRKFLDHDYFTDIITFNLAGPSQKIEGEIYISAERVRENASKLGVSVKNELHRVLFHGILHLCGYGDKTKNDRNAMRKEEDKLLSKYIS